MNLPGAVADALLAVPPPVLAAAVLLAVLAWSWYVVCRGRALLLPQDSADRRELALRKAELRHDDRPH